MLTSEVMNNTETKGVLSLKTTHYSVTSLVQHKLYYTGDKPDF